MQSSLAYSCLGKEDITLARPRARGHPSRLRDQGSLGLMLVGKGLRRRPQRCGRIIQRPPAIPLPASRMRGNLTAWALTNLFSRRGDPPRVRLRAYGVLQALAPVRFHQPANCTKVAPASLGLRKACTVQRFAREHDIMCDGVPLRYLAGNFAISGARSALTALTTSHPHKLSSKVTQFLDPLTILWPGVRGCYGDV